MIIVGDPTAILTNRTTIKALYFNLYLCLSVMLGSFACSFTSLASLADNEVLVSNAYHAFMLKLDSE